MDRLGKKRYFCASGKEANPKLQKFFMALDFSKMNGLLPAVVQDYKTGKVLMVAFMNEEAYCKTIDTKLVTFFSRTKNRLWTKGEESGNFLDLVSVTEDCDHDTLLVKAKPRGAVCHTGADTCFGEKNTSGILFLEYLQNLIATRKKEMPRNSYTTVLFQKGVNKIAQKVGEEAVELVIEAKDSNDELFLNEAADLMFHYLVLLTQKGYALSDVVQVLEKRHS
ncbi:MAG: bifunctional phosphoribosyl-AMP cyclohydrolase/phosphoribosyl-ATP diphosphatase HisIE [Prevotellaceae bacterium]|jgi:phosphoribosyl-ATP pyrophosphohydrolase/phosphoribosyl-AMP cyclohydrolase|nr:bifunctional phosphoribosyl-AMP cyclohydrolase/phosphoribosyl-ATP diphosphatase HisIE [Prevotellaceae bacterium]